MTDRPTDLFDRVEQAASAVAARVPAPPRVAVVLGSGLGPLADRLADRVVVLRRGATVFEGAELSVVDAVSLMVGRTLSR